MLYDDITNKEWLNCSIHYDGIHYHCECVANYRMSIRPIDIRLNERKRKREREFNCEMLACLLFAQYDWLIVVVISLFDISHLPGQTQYTYTIPVHYLPLMMAIVWWYNFLGFVWPKCQVHSCQTQPTEPGQ